MPEAPEYPSGGSFAYSGKITIPISKEPSRDRDLYGIERQLASAVIKDERDLRPIPFPARL